MGLFFRKLRNTEHMRKSQKETIKERGDAERKRYERNAGRQLERKASAHLTVRVESKGKQTICEDRS